MAARIRRWTRFLFLLLNVLLVIVYGLACLAPYIDPVDWWGFALLGLGFPILFVSLLVFALFWLVFKPRFALLSFLPLLAGWTSIQALFAANTTEKFNYTKGEGVIRVAHWNVARFKEWRRNNNRGSRTRMQMMDLLQSQNADVLCLVEFFTSTDTAYHDNITHISRRLGYPYYYLSWDSDGAEQWTGQAIFSRYPIIDSGALQFPRPSIPETLLHADLKVGGDTVRVFTTHLQSVQFKQQDYKTIEDLKGNPDDSLIERSRGTFAKLKRGFQLRSGQAKIIRELTSSSPHPFIITGDFNDVPNSYTYFTIRNGRLKDAFLKEGFGLGRTYSAISPTLRIDYLMATPDLPVEQFHRYVKDYSDHYLLVADFRLVP